MEETVYNDFYIGEDCDVEIVAGCGIHNCGDQESRHDGIHTFHVGRNSHVHYSEKHYAEGDGKGEKAVSYTHLAAGIPFRARQGVHSGVRRRLGDRRGSTGGQCRHGGGRVLPQVGIGLQLQMCIRDR